MEKCVGVVGLGLIGGSIARAYKQAGWMVLAFDTADAVLQYAIIEGVVHDKLTAETTSQCSLIHVAISPKAAGNWIKENACHISKDTVLIDDCGTKRHITRIGFQTAKQYGFTYVGGHPMAGTHMSGYKYSKATMFQNASMIIVPPRFDDIELYDHIKELLLPMGFKKFVFTTAQDHDRMISYTSQLAHVVSNAYIKSPSAQQHKGYSAGSFRDLTRVAWLNEKMWTELFLENKDFLLTEIKTIMGNLQQYSDAIENADAERLEQLLHDGRIAKELSEQS